MISSLPHYRHRWPLNILEYRARSTKVQNVEKAKREEVLIARKEYFAHELSRLEKDINNFSTLSHTSQSSINNYCTRLSTFKTTLEEATEEARTIVEEEEMLGVSEERTKDSLLYKERLVTMTNTQKIFYTLWSTVRDQRANIKDWNNTPLHTMSGEKVTNDADNIKRTMTKLTKKFDKMGKEYEAPARVALEMQQEMINFCRDCNPLLEILCTAGLKKRHWSAINALTKLDIPYVDQGMTLETCVEHGLEACVEQIEETCVNATKEYSLEKALENMEEDWKGLEFGTKAYKDSGTSILTSVEEIQNVLDDQIVRAQAMLGSRYVKPFEARTLAWEKTLNDLQEIMDNWLGMQGTWLYLEPIFSSEDICKQMPKEAKRFRTVDSTFRGAMSRCETEPGVIKIAQTEGLLEQLQKANELLNEIQKGLNDYLETKRVFFPRFFFLGNDEMLEILSETKDPLRVQPHLSKIFEGIASLDFNSNLDINGMISAESENVQFEYSEIGEKKINPQDSNGQVEQWVKEVEGVMRKTVALQVDKSMKAYAKEAVLEGKRETYVQKWPGMVVLCVTSTFWTTEVTAALQRAGEGESDALAKYADQLTKQLFIIVEMVRGKLTKLQRKTISALVTLDVHARDVTAGLAKDGISKVDDFDWLSQMRYYWKEGGESAKTGMPGSVICRMINAERKYAYEYLGNSSRLVITPLTDRCYRTLMTAIHLDYGGAPAGPAGTGKTETVKDLGKAIAIQTVVYNCSDTLDYLAMGKFFKGLAGTGAWACFDEFNRITLEVLSVVAQQILTIQIAKAANLERFDFEGQNIALRRTCCVYITMNPGYAGRQELPDNLKALFRNVAMMVPDYAQIGQIILYSMGYMEGEAIANKIVTTYRLCSEQLSKQRHYDYGMRAVIAVVLAAGNMKRKNPDAPEMELGLRATIDVNLPKFLSYDVPLFNGIVSDLFPGIKVPEVDRGVFAKEMVIACRLMSLQPTTYFLDKVFQIWEMMLIRHGFMIVGLPWGGKTKAYQVLGLTLQRLHQQYPDDPTYCDVHQCVLNPKAITMGQLYGKFDGVTHEWTDGIVAVNYKRFSSNPPKVGKLGDRKWLIFDGPVDAIWIENMNTVLDDNKKLCLESGEMVKLGSGCAMMFEPMDLEVASPATVSRVGVIFMEPHLIGWRPLVLSWLQTLNADWKPVEEREKEQKEKEEREAKEKEKEQNEGEKNATKNEEKNGETEMKTNAKDDTTEKNKKNSNSGMEEEENLPPVSLNAAQCDHLLMLYDWLFDPIACFVSKAVRAQIPSIDQTLVNAMLRLQQSLFDEQWLHYLKGKGANSGNGNQEEAINEKVVDDSAQCLSIESIECYFMFSLIWCIGVTVDDDGRSNFNVFVKNFLNSGESYLDDVKSVKTALMLREWKPPTFPNKKEWHRFAKPMPNMGDVYDYCYIGPYSSKEETPGEWMPWSDMVSDTPIPADAKFSNIVVPTKMSAQLSYVVSHLVTVGAPILITGPTGTGKSVFVSQLLNHELDQSSWTPIELAFSAKTTANQTQDIVDGKLGKRRKGIFGPPIGTQAVIFVDDVNMPEVEEYGAQPPVELLRQFLCQSGWFDHKEKSFTSIVDSQLICAMGPPGGGRSEMTPRFMRHFSTLCLTSFDDATLNTIFGQIMEWHFNTSGMPSNVSAMSTTLVDATLQMYRTAMMGLLPTPLKSHYTFNVRDFAKVMQGCLKFKPKIAALGLQNGMKGIDGGTLVRLWLHEVLRVFGDRLIEEADQEWLLTELRRIIPDHFGNKIEEYLKQCMKGDGVPGSTFEDDEDMVSIATLRRLLFVEFLPGVPLEGSPEGTPGSQATYKEVSDSKRLVTNLETFLEEYNAESKKPMALVLFMFATE